MNVNFTAPGQVSAFLRERGIRPSKALGQNFLADRNVLDCIVREADLPPGAEVVEVGAGLGALTAALLDCGARVTAVEKDPALQAVLEERFGAVPDFSLVRGDALAIDLAPLFAPPRRACLVSNLPYSVGTRVVVDAAACASPPERMVLLLQREVCERFAAPPRSPARGAVSVWLQRLYDVRLARDVPPQCFVPRPEVMSSVVVLRRHRRFPLPPTEAEQFRELVRAGFLHRRKQLRVAMRGAGGLARPADFAEQAFAAAAVPQNARAEELSVEQWLALHDAWFPARHPLR